jgi:uncharacterized protein
MSGTETIRLLLAESWQVMLELSPWLLLGAVIAGLLHVLLPAGFVQRQLRGTWAVPKAVLLGVPLPLCSCGVIPAGIGLKRDGATSGAAVGFLIATPQTGVDSILVAASFLGWPFALWKVASAAATGLVGGWLTDRVGGEGAAASAHAVAATATASAPAAAAPRDARAMVDHSVDMVREIWRWLLFGVVASAAIGVFLPEQSLANIAGMGLLASVVAVLAVSVPLYVCATASVPIAAALVAGGMPSGLALVFLMAGPATNVATIGAIRKTFGTRALVVYLTTIVAGSLAFGLGFDFVLDAGGMPVHEHATEATPWAIGATIALLGMMVWFAGEDVRAWLQRRRAQAPSKAATTELTITGLSCGGCVRKAEGALAGTEGVESAVVQLEGGGAVVQGTASLQELTAALKGAGFGVV